MPGIRVLVVDDSAFMRQHIRRILESDPAFAEVITARDGLDAMGMVERHDPDVVTLDIAMPVQDGLETLRQIMARSPRPCIMLSSLTREGAPDSLAALELGAVDVMEKPSGPISLDIDRHAVEIVTRVKAAAGARLKSRPSAPPARRPAATDTATRTAGVPAQAVVAIGASTGGPRTLGEVISALPGSLPAAVLIVQHIPASFTRAFADRLNAGSALRVKEAEQGEPLLRGVAYVGPGDVHLGVRRSRLGSGAFVELQPEPADSAHRPSVDEMMRAAVAAFGGASVVCVLLTGMGSDGADAMVAARRAGAVTIAEAEESAVIFGMPREAIRRGGAAVVVPASRVAEEVCRALDRLGAVGGGPSFREVRRT